MTAKARAKVVPDYLIYEMDEGKPIYYRGYEDFLDGKKTIEDSDVMADSSLQAWLKGQIITLLNNILSDDFVTGVGEHGLSLAKKTWRAADISIFKVENFEFTDEYAKLPPDIVIEIDTKAHIDFTAGSSNYYYRKTQQLLDFGVQKVIWIFTDNEKIMIAEKGQDWITSDWNKTVEVLENITLNVQELIDKVKK
jgi:Uma2 family endonuclease